MTAHDHETFVPGCFRCDLNRDEMGVDDKARDELITVIYNAQPSSMVTGLTPADAADAILASGVLDKMVTNRTASIEDSVRRQVRGLPCWGPKDGKHYYDDVSVEEVTEAFIEAIRGAILGESYE